MRRRSECGAAPWPPRPLDRETSSVGRRSTLLAYERNEANTADGPARELIAVAHDHRQFLPITVADRHYQPPARGELCQEGRWYLWRRGGHADAVVWRTIRVPERAVAHDDGHVAIIEFA